MSKTSPTLLVATCVVVPAIAYSQSKPDLPRPSPKAQVMQQVGLTDVTVSYSSPGVKGRKILGKLVPYDEIWRTGANEATTITFSRDATFGGQAVKAGSYALFTIPGKSSWSVVLNSDAEAWGAYNHDKAKDVLKITAKTTPAPKRERMAFFFTDTTERRTQLELEWDTMRLSIPITVDTKKHVMASIKETVDRGWLPYARTANYLLEQGDLTTALVHVDTSIGIKGTWWNHWVKAQVLGKQGRKSDAMTAAKRAQELGGDSRGYNFYKKDIATALASWR